MFRLTLYLLFINHKFNKFFIIRLKITNWKIKRKIKIIATPSAWKRETCEEFRDNFAGIWHCGSSWESCWVNIRSADLRINQHFTGERPQDLTRRSMSPALSSYQYASAKWRSFSTVSKKLKQKSLLFLFRYGVNNDVDKPLPSVIAIKCAENHLYRIKLSLFSFGSQTRNKFHNPFFISLMMTVIKFFPLFDYRFHF